MDACLFCCVRFSSWVLIQEIGWECCVLLYDINNNDNNNVSEMTYFVSGGT